MQHQRHSNIDSIDVMDLSRDPLCFHSSLESQDNLRRNVAHAASKRANAKEHTEYPIKITARHTHVTTINTAISICGIANRE